MSVYIGDSASDLPPLMAADLGIIIGSSSTLRRVCAATGVQLKSLAAGVSIYVSNILSRMLYVVCPVFLIRRTSCPKLSITHVVLEDLPSQAILLYSNIHSELSRHVYGAQRLQTAVTPTASCTRRRAGQRWMPFCLGHESEGQPLPAPTAHT